MGKSLSILAITVQVYNIDGRSIWPKGQGLDDNDELPASLEHLRPYLRKRSGPYRVPPGLQHMKSTVSRDLLSYVSLTEVENPITKQMKYFDSHFRDGDWLKMESNRIHHFTNPNGQFSQFYPFYQQLQRGDTAQARDYFITNMLHFNPFTTKLIEDAYEIFYKNGAPYHNPMAWNWFNTIGDAVLFNKQNFDTATVSRSFSKLGATAAVQKKMYTYLYSLAFVTREMTTSVFAPNAVNAHAINTRHCALGYMYSILLEDYQANLLSNPHSFGKFGWIKYSEDFIEAYFGESWDFNDIQAADIQYFEAFIGILIDIRNWNDKRYVMDDKSFKVPYLNTVQFQSEFIVKVLNEGNYGLNQNFYPGIEQPLPQKKIQIIMTIQQILIEWHTAATKRGEAWTRSTNIDKTVVGNKLSKDWLAIDYSVQIASSPAAKKWAYFRGSFEKFSKAPNADVLNYFFQ